MSIFVTPPASMRTATAPQNSAAAPSGSATPPAPCHNDIARRAYEIYVQRGCQQGQCQQNWRQAERDLRHEGQPVGARHACGGDPAPAAHAGSAPVGRAVAGTVPAITP